MASATDTTIILVHGFWGGAAHWSGVIRELAARGHTKIKAVDNPLTSLADDVARTQQYVNQVDGPVLLVGHSYGGAVITEAGDLPNVQGLVYIAAFAPDTGESPGGLSQQRPPAALANVVPDSDGYLWVQNYHESFCQDLTEEDAFVLDVTQKAPLAGTFGDEITAPAWRVKPTWYQISTEDRMINPDNQRMFAERMSPVSVLELAASHASLASQPAEVTTMILAAAETAAAETAAE